jgi:hypothetical protein
MHPAIIDWQRFPSFLVAPALAVGNSTLFAVACIGVIIVCVLVIFGRRGL